MHAGRDRVKKATFEVAGLALWLFVFTRVHDMLGKDAAAAYAHARTVQTVERALHLDVERAANRWLTEHPILIQPAVYLYRTYYVVVLGVLVWGYLRRSAVYPQVRRTLVAMTALVLPVYWLYPLAPPRLALAGVVDIVWGQSTMTIHDGQNTFSAMPSMHVGWSLWSAYAVWVALRSSHPKAALAAWIFPLLMIGVVFTTANHYVLDVIGSIVLVSCAVGVATLVGRILDRVRRNRGGVGRRD
ncbi:MAG: phosphatase PAP2 family protein [Hamadaea sp.]|nr:phosphatase PAP2 family protein [Hamadaea sp.]NUT19989.1 phosphatase PAP2 family protein [Hamadaea sp.]